MPTKQEIKTVNKYAKKWGRLSRTCMSADERLYAQQEEVVRPLLNEVYRLSGCPTHKPAIVWAESPVDIRNKFIQLKRLDERQNGAWTPGQLAELSSRLEDAEVPSKEELKEGLGAVMANMTPGTSCEKTALHDYIANETDILTEKLADKARAMVALASVVHWWLALDHAAIISRFPIHAHYDESGEMHSEHGPAIEYSDGFCIHSVHGNSPKKSSDAGKKLPKLMEKDPDEGLFDALLESKGD